MQVGDGYTFIRTVPILTEDEAPLAAGGLLSKWFRTSEPARVFEVKTVRGATYEAVCVGFQIVDRKPMRSQCGLPGAKVRNVAIPAVDIANLVLDTKGYLSA